MMRERNESDKDDACDATNSNFVVCTKEKMS